jgi:hypothetical protein
MSAYVVSENTINLIVSFAASEARSQGKVHIKLTPEIAKEVPDLPEFVPVFGGFSDNYLVFDFSDRKVCSYVADVLMNENIRSVNARYSEAEEMKGMKFKTIAVSNTIDVVSCCDCLDYQSCETEDWNSTLAHALLKKIHKMATYKVLKASGLDSAPWGIP